LKTFEKEWQGGVGTPRALLARNEVSVCIWKSTPLLEGSVSQTLMQFSFPANLAWGVLLTPQRSFKMRCSSNHSSTSKFSTDNRFINFPMNFALRLLPEQGNLSYLRVAPESGWDGKSITVSLCDIGQVQASYEALGR
jgi:hypothetical protein